MHFALLNNDVLWVLDEVQLFGVGLQTAMQLQSFRSDEEVYQGVYGKSQTIYCSATIAPGLLKTPDYQPSLALFQLIDDDLQDDRVRKLVTSAKPISQLQKGKPANIARFALETHKPGNLTIIRCNTVARAQEIFKLLKGKVERRLVHGRFRHNDREYLDWLYQVSKPPTSGAPLKQV